MSNTNYNNLESDKIKLNTETDIITQKNNKDNNSHAYKICAIICELNPPHNGHKYLFDKAREISCCDFVLAIMSGNFVQRGEPAILPASIRAKLAMQMGADAVVVLGTEYSTASAEIFAKAGVEIINSFKNITHIAFGVQDIKQEKILNLTKNIVKNQKNIDNFIKSSLLNGNSYSKAKKDAITNICKLDDDFDHYFAPNNILAVEYLINLEKAKSNITPVLIPRIQNKNVRSASVLRELINNGETQKIKDFVPQYVFDAISKSHFDYQKYSDYTRTFIASLTPSEISQYRDIGEGLENLLYQNVLKYDTLYDLINSIKSKRYTTNRIARAILSVVLQTPKTTNLNIKIDKLKLLCADSKIIPYLTCNKKLITRVNEIDFDIQSDFDEKAQRIYNSLYHKTSESFWTQKLIKL